MKQNVKYHAGTLTYTRGTLAILFCWLLWGDFCYILMETVVPSILPLKFKSLGASNTTIGMVLTTFPMVINSIFNPIISFKSDRYRSRWGRRIPFILFSTPVIVIFLIGVGFADKIGFGLYKYIKPILIGMTANQFAILVIAVMMIIFSFFNTFVNAVFWYLFNDVVPENLLARFMSWFRIVTMLASSLYNFFIFKFAESHATEIFVGAALLYLIGFGLMSLNVREGEYPPPEPNINNKTGLAAGAMTFYKQCHSLPHYIYIYLAGMALAGTSVVTPFSLLFPLSIGLNVEQVGQITGVFSIVVGFMIVVSGWLADRFHPVRIVILGVILQIILGMPAAMTWLFFSPTPQVSYWLCMLYAIALTAPISAMFGVLDPPMFMRLFPRQLYGQFCSANAMWRSVSLIVNGTLVGIFFDILGSYVGKERAYAFIPVWQMFFFLLMLVFMCKVYQHWKSLGGDESYEPLVSS